MIVALVEALMKVFYRLNIPFFLVNRPVIVSPKFDLWRLLILRHHFFILNLFLFLVFGVHSLVLVSHLLSFLGLDPQLFLIGS
jgi:hypothetical protein